MCGSTVFLKTELFFLVFSVSFQETHPTLLLLAQCILLSRIAVCFVDFNKRLEVIPRIGPLTVSCHSSSAWFLVRLLLPLLFLLRSSSDRLQVIDLCNSTKLRITEELTLGIPVFFFSSAPCFHVSVYHWPIRLIPHPFKWLKYQKSRPHFQNQFQKKT